MLKTSHDLCLVKLSSVECSLPSYQHLILQFAISLDGEWLSNQDGGWGGGLLIDM
jgi:hypothetical protein